MRILLTRPTERAQPLAELITRQGGEALQIPALEIVAIEPSPDARSALENPENFAAALFVSVNAVKFAAAIASLPGLTGIPVIAPGRSTAQCLQSHGITDIHLPSGAHDSEAMLEIPNLQTVCDKPVLIVRGRGGRDTLRAKLCERGARVSIAEVYERRLPTQCADNLAHALQSGLDAVCAASGETLDNLVVAAGERLDSLQGAALFVPSQRVAERARERGFRRVHVTAGPDDAGFAQSLVEWAGRTDRQN